MNQSNTLHRFIFDAHPIRGNLVQLNSTFKDALAHHDYPAIIKNALGELMAAAALLIATLKMEGVLVLQIQGKGALRLLVVECDSDLNMRATAKWDEKWAAELASSINNIVFIDLVKNGHFIITLDPKKGEAYQGIVAIEGETIAEMLQNYMLRSQQIDTALWLACDGKSASGMLLQKLPETGDAHLDADAWNRINQLANTVTPDELQNLPAETLLGRLFAEEDVRLFEPKNAQFHCSCNQNNVANMLHMLGADELNSIVAEFGQIYVNCDFCNKQYVFDAIDTAQLLLTKVPVNPSKATH